MRAVHIRTRIESETLHLPQVRSMIGKDVKIVITEAPADTHRPDVLTLRKLADQIDFDDAAFHLLREISKL